MTYFKIAIQAAFALTLAASITASADQNQVRLSGQFETRISASASGRVPAGQEEVINAQNAGRGLHFVDVKDVEVIRLLPDDTRGSRHQKWIVRLANGRELLAVFNISICDRVPLEVGSRISMGGQYIYDRSGGLIHWLHEDPKNRRPDGYVDVGGRRYGQFKN